MKQILSVLTLLLCLQFTSVAQQTIYGTVTDKETNEPLENVNILIKELNQGTITDEDGKYEINGVEGTNFTIIASHVAYTKREKKITITGKGKAVINFQLLQKSFESSLVTITGTRTQREVSQVPARVNMISPKQIDASPAQSADAILNYTSGVSVNRSGGFLSHRSNVTMRGMSGAEQSRVLILLDGVPLNKADGGSVNWNFINMENIAKIEVLKGPGSSLYGSNAMGGVVQMFSKKPQEKIEGSVRAEYGDLNTFGGKINIGGRLSNTKNKGFYYGVNGFYRQSDGYINFPEEERDEYTIASDLQEYAAGVKLGYDFGSKSNIELNLNYFDDQRGNGTKIYIPEGERQDHDTYAATLKYNTEVDGYRMNAIAYYRQEDYFKTREKLKKGDYTCYAVDSDREDFGVSYYVSKELYKYNDLTFGFDIKQGKVDAVDDYTKTLEYFPEGDDVTDMVYNRGTMNTLALFVQDEISFTKQFKVVAGLRFDYANFYDGAYYIENATGATDILNALENKNLDEYTWGAFSPRVSAQYEINKNARIFVSYAKGFRPPVLDDLCRSGFIRGGFKQANPELKPEILHSFELGGDVYAMDKKFHFAPTAFYSIGKDFMYYVSTGDSIAMGSRMKPIRQRDNIGAVEIYGAEAEASYQILRQLSAIANYTYSEATITEHDVPAGEDNLVDKTLTYVPKHQFTVGARWSGKRIQAGAYYKYKSEFFADDVNEVLIDPRGQIDLKLQANVFKGLSLGVMVNDLLDNQTLVDEDYLPMGRFIKGEISYKF